MILLFTDFGLQGPYLGQVRAVLAQQSPNVPVIDLMADAPVHDPVAASHLLAAYQAEFPAGSIFLCVIDPGVGSKYREPLIVHADEHWYVGPGNGLFDVVAARSATVEAWRITWKPKRLSASFHGRDLFAPVTAMLACGSFPEAKAMVYPVNAGAGDDLSQLIYIDHFGNLITGMRASSYATMRAVRLKGQTIPRCKTFSDVTPGAPLCYENSSGLLEIAVNQGRAEKLFSARIGDEVVPV